MPPVGMSNAETSVHAAASPAATMPMASQGPMKSTKGNKKSRKPYTITKPRESWTDEEHDLFVEALKLYERDWKKIEGHVKSKTVIQIRSHAQKYFIKMQKTGKNEMIPPPRPKRRSKKPYPKARDRSKKLDGGEYSHHGSMEHIMPGMGHDYMQNTYPYGMTTGVSSQHAPRAMIPQSVGPSLQWALWERQQLAELQQEQLSQAQYYLQQAIAAHTSEESKSDPNESSKTPNFQRIYSFLGSLFDPSTTGHVVQLHGMDELDRQVVQLLMQNLANNLGKHYAVTTDYQCAEQMEKTGDISNSAAIPRRAEKMMSSMDHPGAPQSS